MDNVGKETATHELMKVHGMSKEESIDLMNKFLEKSKEVYSTDFYKMNSNGQKLKVDLTTLGDFEKQDVMYIIDPEDFSASILIKNKFALKMTLEQYQVLKNKLA